MIQHVSIGVRNIGATKTFYDSALEALGYRCLRSRDTWLGYGKDRIEFSARLSESPVPADPKSGLHFCFSAPSRKSVEAFYEAALAQGGRDNGKPGLRTDYGPNYFAAYVIDPDGYRLEACNNDVEVDSG
jgi:catechol 2,3-dioxygenase-like lactoylglutathione lyase family enzyme